MADIHDMINAPIEVKIGEKTLKVKRLSIEELFGFFEGEVKSRKIKEANEIAKFLTGPDKIEFLKQAWKELPVGEELIRGVQGILQSLEGIRLVIFKAAQKVNKDFKMEDLDGIVDAENVEEVAPVVEYLCGMSKKKPIAQQGVAKEGQK